MYEEEDDRLPRQFMGQFQAQFQGNTALSQRMYDASIVQMGMAARYGSGPQAEDIDVAFAAAFPALAQGRNLSFPYAPMPGPLTPTITTQQHRRPSFSAQQHGLPQQLTSLAPQSVAPTDLDCASPYMSRSDSRESVQSIPQLDSRHSSLDIQTTRPSGSMAMLQAPSTPFSETMQYALTSPVIQNALPLGQLQSADRVSGATPAHVHRRTQSFDAQGAHRDHVGVLDNMPASATLSSHMLNSPQHAERPSKRQRSDAGLAGLGHPGFDAQNGMRRLQYHDVYSGGSMVSPNTIRSPTLSPGNSSVPTFSGPRSVASYQYRQMPEQKHVENHSVMVPKLQPVPNPRRPIAEAKGTHQAKQRAVQTNAAANPSVKTAPPAEEPLPTGEAAVQKPVTSVKTETEEDKQTQESASPQTSISMHDLAEPLNPDANNIDHPGYFGDVQDPYSFGGGFNFDDDAGGFLGPNYNDQNFDMSAFFNFPNSQDAQNNEELFQLSEEPSDN